LGGNGCSAASTSTLAIFLIEIVPRHKATTLMPVIQRVKKHYFVTSMIDHETVNYSQHFVNLVTGVCTKTVPYRPNRSLAMSGRRRS